MSIFLSFQSRAGYSVADCRLLRRVAGACASAIPIQTAVLFLSWPHDAVCFFNFNDNSAAGPGAHSESGSAKANDRPHEPEANVMKTIAWFKSSAPSVFVWCPPHSPCFGHRAVRPVSLPTAIDKLQCSPSTIFNNHGEHSRSYRSAKQQDLLLA